MTAWKLHVVAGIASAIVGCSGGDTAPLDDVSTEPPVPGLNELLDSSDARPKIRWWWTCGDMSPEDIAEELTQMAEAGFGAAEVLCTLTADPANHGWGSPAMSDRMEAALEYASQLGIRLDFTLGPAWPLVVPGLTPDTPGTQQELVYGSAVVEGGATFSGPLPEPSPAPPEVTQRSLISVQAVRCVADCTEAKPVMLQAESSIDLTASVQDGGLTWTAPSEGTWTLFSFWQRGTAQITLASELASEEITSVSPAYVVDHFSAAGAQLVTRFWDTNVLTPTMRGLLATAGGHVYIDSLELKANLLWTPDLLAEFTKRRGYALNAHLPALFIAQLHEFLSGATPDSAPDYELSDGIGARARNDYYQTLTELYQETHLATLRSWAQSLGLALRAQAYAITIDSSQAAMVLDVPEVESLGRFGNIDQYRAVASATHIGDKRLLSFECCAEIDAAYAQTWQAMLAYIQEAYAGGVNHVVVHGFAAEHGLGLPWPGFSPFTLFSDGIGAGPGFSEAWGPRQPMWKDMPKVTGWMSRMQSVLRHGQQKVDVAIYRQGYYQDGTIYADPGLGARGYSYDFVDAAQLDQREPRVQRGRLYPDGPAYGALILDNQEALPLRAARGILEDTRAGLPVVVVGAPPSRTPGVPQSPEEDSTLREEVDRLLAEPTVARVATREEVPAALAQLGVRAAAEIASGTDIRVVHRGASNGDFYYLYNHGSSAQATQIALEGTGRPIRIDPWTGATSAIAHYHTTEEGRIEVPLTLSAGDSTVIAVTPTAASRLYAVDTTGGEVLDSGKGLVLRATEPGRYDVVVSDGRTLDVAIASVPSPIALTDWHINVSDWRQGDDGQLIQMTQDLDLQGLAAWPDIPELEDVSGIGSYSASFTVGEGWTRDSGAYLDLGKVVGTYDVAINGTTLPAVNQVTARVDVGPYLVAGRNTVTVEVATTLRNRLRVTPGFPGQAAVPRQPVGLIGPVRVIPYGQVVVR
ncbi:glycosyl hydrolase [Sorangium sp. So ce726]|uniref:glycosyl hydrolase n=1 Tax=Sorangium sp. So ce726 TaxID=3133319 RepID=UPI003F5E7F6B